MKDIDEKEPRKKEEPESKSVQEEKIEKTIRIVPGGFPEDIEFVKLRCPKCGYTTEVREYDPDNPPHCPNDGTPMEIV